MRIAVPKEIAAGELRVALVPEAVSALIRKEVGVVVESGAGAGAGFSDDAFAASGATVLPSGQWQQNADLIAKVAPPTVSEIATLHEGAVLVGFLAPLTSPETVKALAEAQITSFAMEAVPRVTRAQSMDALSSQSSVTGYRAALIAAQELNRFFPMLTTAAGTVRPAKVLVLGAGVAGLQAIATARRLGAIVTAFDVRAAAKEQVESLGARFLDVDSRDAESEGGYARELTAEEQQAQQQALEDAVADSDAVITTALVPGRPAPKLVTKAAAARMRTGSVVVDLAGEAGGNCELTRPGETVLTDGGAKVISPLNLPSSLAEHASMLYARNIQAFVELLIKDVERSDDEAKPAKPELKLDFDDEIVSAACVTHGGEVVHEGARKVLGLPERKESL